MEHIIVNFQPFVTEQHIMVYRDGACIEQVYVDFDKVIERVCFLSNKYNISNIDLCGNTDFLKKVKNEYRKMYAGEEFGYRDVTVKAIKVPHDVPCFAYSIIKNQKKISILTDLGHTTDRILESVRGSNIVYLEANYDEKMLKEGTKYPLPLKRRISGQFGHLSNTDTAKAILYLAKYGTKQFVLSHLSKENNTPDLAFDYITNIISRYGIIEGVNIKIDVASTNIGTIFKIV